MSSWDDEIFLLVLYRPFHARVSCDTPGLAAGSCLHPNVYEGASDFRAVPGCTLSAYLHRERSRGLAEAET